MKTLDDVLRIPNERVTLKQQAIDRLRQAILESRFQAGERLVERTLGDAMGVSRTAVREALCHLEAEGLVESGPRGPRVAQVTAEDARAIYEAREVLEAAASRWFAERATKAQIQQLDEAADALEVAFATGDMHDDPHLHAPLLPGPARGCGQSRRRIPPPRIAGEGLASARGVDVGHRASPAKHAGDPRDRHRAAQARRRAGVGNEYSSCAERARCRAAPPFRTQRIHRRIEMNTRRQVASSHRNVVCRGYQLRGDRGVSRQAGDADRPVRARRKLGHHRPQPWTASGRAPRSARRDRERRRRRRDHRHHQGRACEARRVHRTARLGIGNSHQQDHQPEDAIRRDQGFDAARVHRHRPDGAGRQDLAAREQRGRSARAGARQARQPELRVGGQRYPDARRRRAPEDPRQGLDGARSLQRGRPCPDRPRRRSDRSRRIHAERGAAAHSSRAR